MTARPAINEIPELFRELLGLRTRIQNLSSETSEWENESYAKLNALSLGIDIQTSLNGEITAAGDFSYLANRLREHVSAQTLQCIIDQMIDSNGVLNIDAVADLLGLATDGTITNRQWQAIIEVISDPRVSHQDIVHIFDINTRLDRYLVPISEDVAARLGRDLSAALIRDFEIHQWNGTLTANMPLLENQLQRAQLVTFIGEAGNLVTEDRFKGRFEQGHSEVDLARGFANGHIRFDRTEFPVSSMYGLQGIEYLSDSAGWDSNQRLAQAQNAGMGWLSFLGTIGWGTISLIDPSPISGAIDMGRDVGSFVSNTVNAGVILNNAQITHLHEQHTLAVDRLGGGVASVETPNGYRQLGYTLATTVAQDRLERIANLPSQEGIDFTNADVVKGHLIYGEGSGFEAIDQHLRNAHPNAAPPEPRG